MQTALSTGAAPRPRALLRPLAAAMAALVLGSCARRGDAVVLGLQFPLTDVQGKPDLYGELSRMGAQLALDEINGKGGVRGRPLAVRLVNDRGDDSTAIGVADSLANDPRVVAVVGPIYSGTTTASARVYEDARLPALATSATSPEISRLGPYIFRLASSDSANAVALASVARATGLRTAILYSNEDYGVGLMRYFARSLSTAGAAPVGEDPYLEEMEDFRPYLLRLKARGAQLVFIAGIDQGARTIIPQAREVGLDARFMGGDGIEALKEAGPAFDGTVIGVLFHPDASPKAREFAHAFRARWSREPDSSAALAYDAVYLLARALADGANDRESVRRYLARVGRPGGSARFDGAGGPVAFDANGDPQGKTCVIGTVRGGRIVLERTGG
ncbi:MAG TPA: ABC transporter substrate-binding protein [Longimicrobium sp.]|jgi:branched-chain amino acid transport system substrate-binding protein|nr:ABC transporter substrate-binding protein [Longimicrobium sp.]